MKTLEELQREYNESKDRLEAAATAHQQAENEEKNAYYALQKEKCRIKNEEVDAKMASIPVGTILLSKDGSFRTCGTDYDLIYIVSIKKNDNECFAYGRVHYYKFEKGGKNIYIKTYQDDYIFDVNYWLFYIPKASDHDIKLVKNSLTRYTKLLGGK